MDSIIANSPVYEFRAKSSYMNIRSGEKRGGGGGQLRRIFSKFRNESCTCIEIGEKGMTEEASVPL